MSKKQIGNLLKDKGGESCAMFYEHQVDLDNTRPANNNFLIRSLISGLTLLPIAGMSQVPDSIVVVQQDEHRIKVKDESSTVESILGMHEIKDEEQCTTNNVRPHRNHFLKIGKSYFYTRKKFPFVERRKQGRYRRMVGSVRWL